MMNEYEARIIQLQDEVDSENRQKRQLHLVYMLTVEQLADALGLKTIEGKSTGDLVLMVKQLRQLSMEFMAAHNRFSQLQASALELYVSPEDWDIVYDNLNTAKAALNALLSEGETNER